MDNLIEKIFNGVFVNNLTNKIAIKTKDDEITYSNLANLVASTVEFLKRKKLKKNDIILNALGNTIQQIIVHYASFLIGIIAIPVPSYINRNNASFYIENFHPVLIFSNSEISSLFKIPAIEINNFNELEKITKNIFQIYKYNINNKVNPNDIISVLLTTGSSGIQKAVKLTHRSINQAIDNITGFIKYTNKNKEIIPIPINHSFGLGHVYCTHVKGGSVYLLDGIKSLKEFYYAFKFDYNGIALTPSIIKLLTFEKTKEKTLQSFNKLDYMVINSEVLDTNITKLLKQNCSNLIIYYYYGLTEASRSFFINLSLEKEKYYKSVGKPTSKDVKVKLIEDEIYIGGNHLFSGYMNSENSNIINGYFKTGDLGYLDSQGYLFITGRKKNIINVGGFKVSALHVSETLKKIDGIEDIAVISIFDSITGEKPAALIVGKNLSKEKIMNFSNKNIDFHAIPKKIVFHEFIPKSDTGKIIIEEVRRIIEED
jgi:long-chain acyl-CoA synthetase